MRGLESPNYYYEHFAENPPKLKEKVLKFARAVYTEEDALKYTQEFIAEKTRMAEKAKISKVTLMALIGPKDRKRFILASLLNFLQQMSGINFMMFFSTQLFDEISGNGPEMTMVLSFGIFTGAVLSVLVINKGRKPGMLYPTLLTALSLFALIFTISYEIGWLAMISMFLYVLGFGVGYAAIFTVYVVEILPALGAGLTFGVQWITAAGLGLLGPVLLDLVAVEVVVAVFCVFSFVGCWVMWVFCEETAGRSEEEIERAFGGLEGVEGSGSGKKE